MNKVLKLLHQKKEGQIMESKLIKNCPFCGLSDLYLTKQYIIEECDNETEIFCNTCKISFRREDDSGVVEWNEEKLIKFWNKEREYERQKDE